MSDMPTFRYSIARLNSLLKGEESAYPQVLKNTRKLLVGTGRFELPTPRTPSECSTRLSHVPTVGSRCSSEPRQAAGLTKEFYTSATIFVRLFPEYGPQASGENYRLPALFRPRCGSSSNSAN